MSTSELQLNTVELMIFIRPEGVSLLQSDIRAVIDAADVEYMPGSPSRNLNCQFTFVSEPKALSF